MTVGKINAITVPPDGGDELARRFAARAGAVDNQDGFEGFELLRPTDERTTWLVVTRWRDGAAFEAWRTSPAFGHGHRQAAQAAAAHSGAAHSGAVPSGAAHSPAAQSPAADSPTAGHGKPVAVSSELWSFEIAGGAGDR
ncbi:MAG TPA: antibiotic biosynthesis monooxygenase family protein [Streptosporangiaceae bacterium]|nr:antibiotic biosynthesis monooxygenase family protein [Streptosporangiaceae bacterium]